MLIGELSRLTGASARSLRYYEAQGLLQAERDPNGYRRYDHDAVGTVRTVRALLAAGFTSEVVADLLPCARGEKPTIDLCPDVVATMRRTLAGIETSLSSLERQHSAITGLLGSETAPA